jgi:hypothetical protein
MGDPHPCAPEVVRDTNFAFLGAARRSSTPPPRELAGIASASTLRATKWGPHVMAEYSLHYAAMPSGKLEKRRTTFCRHGSDAMARCDNAS